MCLITLAWQCHPDYPLVVAANRDEFFARPARPAHWWEDAPEILAGRDMQAGGTWLGVNRAGHFSALTNYRDPRDQRPGAPSRGELVRRCLSSAEGTLHTLDQIAAQRQLYAGFNLLAYDGKQLAVHESRSGHTFALEPGIHGLSNQLLNTPWPKLQRARLGMRAVLDAAPTDHALPEQLLSMLRDDTRADDDALPSTGVSLEWERLLSSIFIRAEGYGTRCSSVVLFHRDGRIDFQEWSWGADGQLLHLARQTFQATQAPQAPQAPDSAALKRACSSATE